MDEQEFADALRRIDREFGEAVTNLRDWSTPIDVAQLLDMHEVGLHTLSRQDCVVFIETWSDLTDGFELNKLAVSVGWADCLIEAGGGLIGAVLDGHREEDPPFLSCDGVVTRAWILQPLARACPKVG